MRQTVLEALRRPLDALRRALHPERRPKEHRILTPDLPEPYLADGGGRGDPDDDHLRDVPDGAGCTEIWEYLSERQAAEAGSDD